AAFLKQIIDLYPEDILGDDALYKLAEIYEYKLPDKAVAMQYYLDLFTKYPGSLFAVDARKHFRMLRGDKLAE
ncbi:MAG TPA: tetratricopeptide repeat protein, partial [Bacteroidia bacterium]|nr:tetratricopeptide repeat protein [Bacteroidia bacterium]